jgi:peptidoglycan biosynthesis protein MviN/MurJ (putative lipid II flippase)
MTHSQIAVMTLFIIGVPAIAFSLVRTWRTFFSRTTADWDRRALAFVYMFHAAAFSAALFVAICVFEYGRWSSSAFVAVSAKLLAVTVGLPILYLAALYCRGFFEDLIQKLRKIGNRVRARQK